MQPQQQAEFLLKAAVNRSADAAQEIGNRAPSWRGHIQATAQLDELLNAALISPDLNARAAALETKLAADNIAKNPRSVHAVIARIDREPSARPWGLWMLGALGNRGVESSRALSTLVNYAHDSDERTRYWAVEGLSVLGIDGSVQPLLALLRDDPSPSVRDRAACALAQSGMLTMTQRSAAVPALIDYIGDGSLDAGTHDLVYNALRHITGEALGNNSAAWRSWFDASGH